MRRLRAEPEEHGLTLRILENGGSETSESAASFTYSTAAFSFCELVVIFSTVENGELLKNLGNARSGLFFRSKRLDNPEVSWYDIHVPAARVAQLRCIEGADKNKEVYP